MRVPASFALSLLGFAVFCTACGGGPATEASAAAVMPKHTTSTDASAFADLQVSEEWNKPSCRWLETGAHLLAWPQDTAVLRAGHDLGLLVMEQAGTGNRIGRPEPAWSISLTEAGKAESATCGPGSSRSEVFGVPVSKRRFISGKRVGEPDLYNPDRTMFEVQFEWVPTPAGDQVKHVLTSHMTVQQGPAKATVVMMFGPNIIKPGPNGWRVQQIHEPFKPTPR